MLTRNRLLRLVRHQRPVNGFGEGIRAVAVGLAPLARGLRRTALGNGFGVVIDGLNGFGLYGFAGCGLFRWAVCDTQRSGSISVLLPQPVYSIKDRYGTAIDSGTLPGTV